MEERARQLVGGCAPGYPQAARIYDWVRERHEYRYGASDASTGALDTIENGAGVCRDFAHVGVALSRALHLPTRFVAGYLDGHPPHSMSSG